MKPQLQRWQVHADADATLSAAARRIEAAARDAIDHRGAFRIALSGGETPRRLYSMLAAAAARWDAWHVYWGDERCVPAGDAQRNDAMAQGVWLNASRIPRGQIHPIPAELGPEVGAAAYSQTLQGLTTFDLVLLGLGEDGHTASLFPGRDWGVDPESPAALAVREAHKPPRDRISLSAARLSAAHAVLVLAPGEGKKDAVRRWESGENLPIRAITPEAGIDAFVDRASAPRPCAG